MKKVLLVLLAVLSLSSCSKEDVSSETLLQKVKSNQFVKELDVDNKNAYLNWNNGNLEIIERWRYSNPDVCWYKYDYTGVATVASDSEYEFELIQPISYNQAEGDWEENQSFLTLTHRVRGYYSFSGELVVSHYVSYYSEGDEWLDNTWGILSQDENNYYEFELSMYEDNHECIIVRD